MRPVVLAAWILFPLAGLTRATEPPQQEISLPQCLQIAIDHNPQLRLASDLFLGAEGKEIILHAILYPTVQAQALSTPTTLYVQFQQTLYNHAILPQLRLSRLTQEQAQINYRQTFNEVMYQVRQAFISALSARAEVDLYRNYAEHQVDALNSAQKLFNAGQVQKNTVLSIEVKANLAKQTQTQYELQYAQALLALDNVLGQELPASTHLRGDLLTHAPSALDAGKLTAEALQNRSDLKLLESMQLSDAQQIEIDTQTAFPIFTASSGSAFQAPSFGPIATGGYDLERNYNEPATQRQTGNSQVPLGVSLNWLFFDGGYRRGLKQAEKAQIASRDVALEELRQSIAQEVNSAVATMIQERDTLQNLGEEASDQELRQLAELEYKTGRLRQLDKANLEDDILEQQQLRLSAEVGLSQAAAALDHAMGDGLETSVARVRP